MFVGDTPFASWVMIFSFVSLFSMVLIVDDEY